MYFSIDFNFGIYIDWGKTLDAFKKQHSTELIRYAHNDTITYSHISIIPGAIFKVEHLNLV